MCDQFTVLWLLTKIYTLEVLLSLHPNSLVSKINIVRDYSILKEIYVSSQLTDGVPKHPHQVSCSSHRVASFQFGMPLGYFWQEKCMLFCAAVELIWHDVNSDNKLSAVNRDWDDNILTSFQKEWKKVISWFWLCWIIGDKDEINLVQRIKD